jgi:lipid-A-disaccharide synthase
MTIKIAIIAGEPSGDLLASELMDQLSHIIDEDLDFFGIGGDNMQKNGLHSRYNMDILSVGGYGLDVLIAIPKIYQLYKKIVKDIIDYQPDFFIGVDAPDFNFHVEGALKKQGIKTIHYISPTIWAWRYERIFKIKKTTDLMLCIFPMEEDIYRKESIKAKFIGNPIAKKTPLNIDTDYYIRYLEDKYQINLIDKNIFTILVGSRKREINSLGPILLDTCNIIASHIPDAIFLFSFEKQTNFTLFNNLIHKHDNIQFKYQVFFQETINSIRAAQLVIAKSGTVSLEVALAKKPMIVCYKVSKLTELIVKRKIKIKYVSQPNILLNKPIVPELLQQDANPTNLATKFIDLYNNKILQQQMIDQFVALHRNLIQVDTDGFKDTIYKLMYQTV